MTGSERWFSSATQIYWACKALIEGRTLTRKTEIREAKGWRPAAIVERLRKRYGWPILTEYLGPENVAHYRLAPGVEATRLKLPPSAARLAYEVAQ